MPARARHRRVKRGPLRTPTGASWLHAPEVRAFGSTGGPVHNDFAFITLTIVFFVLAGLLTVACDKIIGPDPVEELDEETRDERVAA